jgi:hypothetical protein
MLQSSALLLSWLIVSLNTVSCKKDLSTGNDFLIKVDSINVPRVVNSETSFDIIFFGTIGFTGCVSELFRRLVLIFRQLESLQRKIFPES